MPQGLTATPLATYYNAPILITRKNSLPDVTKNEIMRLQPKTAFIGGSAGVVSENIVNELKSLGVTNITRLGGTDRYETALEIVKYIDTNCFDISEVVVANGYGEADSLSIASVSGSHRMPVILTPVNDFTSNSYNWLSSQGLTNGYVIGSTGVTSDNILNKLNNITSMDISNNRLGGIDRYETNAKVVERFFGDNLTEAYVTKGYNDCLIDALSSGPISALNNAPVILLNNGNTVNRSQEKVLTPKTSPVIYEVGGGLSSVAVKRVSELLSTTNSPLPTGQISFAEIEESIIDLGYKLDADDSGYGVTVYRSQSLDVVLAFAHKNDTCAIDAIEISILSSDLSDVDKVDLNNVKTILNWIFKTSENSIYDKTH